MVLVIGLSGSPRREGNTETLLDSALEGAREEGAEAIKVPINELDMKGCQECMECLATGECVIDDDMRRIYELMEEADVLLVASPIFFSGLSSQVKMVIDRCQCIWARKYRLHRPLGDSKRRVGAFLSVGGRKRSDFSNAISVIKVFLINLDVEYAGELTFTGIDEKGSILDYPDLLRKARELGREMVRQVA
jgi:multimeric flavodoxin WrbA